MRRQKYPDDSIVNVPYIVIVKWKRLGWPYSATKKLRYFLKIKSFGKVLSLEETCHLHILRRTGDLLTNLKVKMFNYSQFPIPHKLIRITGWRKYYKPSLTSTTIPKQLRKDLLCTKILANCKTFEAMFAVLYMKLFQRDIRQLNFDWDTFRRFLRRPFYRKPEKLSFQSDDLFMSQLEKVYCKTLTIVFYRNVFINIDENIIHFVHMFSGGRTRCEVLVQKV